MARRGSSKVSSSQLAFDIWGLEDAVPEDETPLSQAAAAAEEQRNDRSDSARPGEPRAVQTEPAEAAQLAAQMNRRTVSVDDPYLLTLGLMTNNQMAANEVLYA